MTCLVFLFLGLGLAGAAEAPLSFDDALATIVRRSTTVASQQANLGATRARNLPIRLAFVPSVTGDGTQTTAKTENTSAVRVRSALLTARLNLFRFGADAENWMAASSDERAQTRQLEATVLRAEDSAVQVLVADLQRRQEVDILTRIAETQRRLLGIARQRYDRGLLPMQEANKLEVDLANAVARQNDAEIGRAAARANLESALGSSEVTGEWPWKTRFSEASTARLLKAELEVSSVPAWRAANEQLSAEDARQSRNLRTILPSLDSSFAYGYTNITNPSGPYVLGWTGTLSLTVPLFDRLSNYSNYRAQTYTRQVSELALEQADRDARAEWFSSRQAFELAFRSALSRDATLKVSRRLYEDNLRRFQAGRTSANDLNVDQNRLFDSELLTVQGWSAAHLSYTRLCHALGRTLHACLN